MKKIYVVFFLLTINLSFSQIGIGSYAPDLSAELEIKSTDKGVLIPRIALSSLTQRLKTENFNADALLIFNNGTVFKQGFYFWKANHNAQNENDGTGNWINLNSETSALPKFFYMPSVLLPTNRVSTSFVVYNSATQTYTVDIYAIYKSQFDNPIKSSNASASSLSSLVLNRNQYEYHILYADNSVFPNADIVFSTTPNEEGKFTYKANPDAIVRNGSFMNIVLKVKN